MSFSLCLTVLNEQKNLKELLTKILSYKVSINEIIIVDGGSTDKTVKVIEEFQKKTTSIKLFSKNCSRSEGRNIAVNMAKNNIILMTDAGCIPNMEWFDVLTKSFKNKEVDVVAGFYSMKYKNKLQKAESLFLGVLPENFSDDFLPSTRSIAFRKSIWEKVGGFPEELDDTAEDTIFNYRLIKNKARFARMKSARVEWGMPSNLKVYFKKIFKYTKGDVKSKIWIFPGKGLTSHNVKAFMVFLRYLLLFVLFSLLFLKAVSPFLIIFLIMSYLFYIFIKIFKVFREIDTALIGIFVHLGTDIAVILGFISGIIETKWGIKNK